MRVKVLNVTPGYWRRIRSRPRAAFDEELATTAWATRSASLASDDPTQGFLFDGRIGEDFKLSTGTWVGVGALRAKIVAHFAPYVRDAVITGHDRDAVGMLAVADQDACRRLCPDLHNARRSRRWRRILPCATRIAERSSPPFVDNARPAVLRASTAPSCSSNRCRSIFRK